MVLKIDGEGAIDGCWSSLDAKGPSDLFKGTSKP